MAVNTNKIYISGILTICFILTILLSNHTVAQSGHDVIVLEINKKIGRKVKFPIFDSLYMSEQRYLDDDTLVLNIEAIRKDSIKQSLGYFYYTPFNYTTELIEKEYTVSDIEIANIKWGKVIFFKETVYLFLRRKALSKKFVLKKTIFLH